MDRFSKPSSKSRARVIPIFVLIVTAAASMTSPARSAEITGKGFPLRNTNATPVPYVSAAASANSVNNVVPYSQTQSADAAKAAPGAATASPQPAAAIAPFEESPIAFAGSDRRRTRGNEVKGYSMPSIWPALFAVAAVCGLFVCGLCLMKKYLPGHRQLFNHPAMELLGRTHLDQKRFVTLLRVGRRLVVVGVCSEEMRTLSEITDEAEITEIMEVARPKTEVGLTIFQRLFQKNVVEAEAEETRAMAREKVAELDAQMSSLRERVREIRSEEKPDEKKHRRRRQLDAVG